MAVVSAVPAYDSAYYRIVSGRKALTDSQRELVLRVSVSEICAGSQIELFIETAYS